MEAAEGSWHIFAEKTTPVRARRNSARTRRGELHQAAPWAHADRFTAVVNRQGLWPILDDAYAAWDLATRRQGQIMHERIVSLKRTQLQMEAQDESVAVSNKQMAS